MPVRRRNDKRRAELTDEHEAWLAGDDRGSVFVQFSPATELKELWEAHAERIVADHVADYPGTRPTRWWEFESDQTRRRLGGTNASVRRTGSQAYILIRSALNLDQPVDGEILFWHGGRYSWQPNRFPRS
jgi:hypothetical protein